MLRTLFFALLAFPWLAALAQPALVTTRLFTYAPGGLPASFAGFYRTGQKVEPFNASAGTLGLPIDYVGPAVFELRPSVADFAPPPEGQKPQPPLASVTLPANADNVLVLCSSLADGKLRLTAYDISSGQLKPGDYRAFNFSRLPLSVILGDNRFALNPGKDTFIKDSKFQDKPIAFPLQIATITDGKAKKVFSSFWEHYPSRRNLLFFFDGRHPSEPITFANFSADLPAPKAAATATPSP